MVYEQVGTDESTRFGALDVKLKPPGQRARTAVEFERVYAARLQAIAGAKFSFQPQPQTR
jgi:hypothetical protein